jgi:hypothetical protein
MTRIAMGAEREDLARRILREYHSHGIPARVERGLVLVHRDGELTGPLRPDLVAHELRADIERVKRRVLAKLVHYGVIDYVRNGDDGEIVGKYDYLMVCKSFVESNAVGELQDHFRAETDILVRWLADPDFAAYPFYWTVAWEIVHELGGSAEE